VVFAVGVLTLLRCKIILDLNLYYSEALYILNIVVNEHMH
jgi:hypothetical protein